MVSSIMQGKVSEVLDELHTSARGDALRFVGLVPRIAWGWLRGRDFQEAVSVEAAKEIYMPVSREQGRFLYLVGRSLRARSVVEFGSSFGISTLYLAAAIRDNGGGRVIGTEMEPGKHRQASANLERAGLGDVAEVRLGDAMHTLATDPKAIDLVLLDGWKDLYLPVLKLLTPRLAPGAVVLADNIHTFKRALKPYVAHVQSGEAGFESVTLPLGAGMEYSVHLGAHRGAASRLRPVST